MLLIILAVYVIVSLVTIVVYAVDKRAAIKNRRRVPEGTLHLLALLGGIPGALIAQQSFKHKRKKLGFMAVTVLITVVHLAAWAGWMFWRHSSG